MSLEPSALLCICCCCVVQLMPFPLPSAYTELNQTQLSHFSYNFLFLLFHSILLRSAFTSCLYFFLPPIPLCSSISDIFSSILHSLSLLPLHKSSQAPSARVRLLFGRLYVLRASRALTIVSNHLSPCLCVCCTTRQSSRSKKRQLNRRKFLSLSLSDCLFFSCI